MGWIYWQYFGWGTASKIYPKHPKPKTGPTPSLFREQTGVRYRVYCSQQLTASPKRLGKTGWDINATDEPPPTNNKKIYQHPSSIIPSLKPHHFIHPNPQSSFCILLLRHAAASTSWRQCEPLGCIPSAAQSAAPRLWVPTKKEFSQQNHHSW